MKKIKMLSDYCKDWEIAPTGHFVVIPGFHRNGSAFHSTFHRVHFGNTGAYIWWNRSTYYISYIK